MRLVGLNPGRRLAAQVVLVALVALIALRCIAPDQVRQARVECGGFAEAKAIVWILFSDRQSERRGV